MKNHILSLILCISLSSSTTIAQQSTNAVKQGCQSKNDVTLQTIKKTEAHLKTTLASMVEADKKRLKKSKIKLEKLKKLKAELLKEGSAEYQDDIEMIDLRTRNLIKSISGLELSIAELEKMIKQLDE